MTTTTWTTGLKKAATVLATGGLALTTIMIGGVAFAPAAQACDTYRCESVTIDLSGKDDFCLATGVNDTITWSGSATEYYYVIEQGHPRQFECPMTQAEATAEAQRQAEIALEADRIARTAGATPGRCAVTVSWMGEAATSGSAEYCTVEGATVTLAYSGTGRSSSTTSQADATYQAQLIADREAQADLLSMTPTGATPGACPAPEAVEPVAVAPVEPAVVGPVEAATVALPAPATVQVPVAATPLPASIPAGDGSSVPQPPVALLGLLALAAAVAVTSGLRMATNR
jgi:hypothetical protein